jgi:CDGSH-type Zn-finger protein
VLVEGPVEIVLPGGRTVTSDRPVTALCVCRRSRRYPFCDTSHRQQRGQRRKETAT